MSNYLAVSNTNQGSFNNPRQKTWAVMQSGVYGWGITYMGGDFEYAKKIYGDILRAGGMYTSIDRVMILEVVPADIAITPTV